LPFPLPVRAVMLIVVVIGSGIKLAIFDGKKAKVILINEGYKVISILLFLLSLTLFGKYIVF
jgi:capsular polysaccharide biosynthesis protein